MTSKDPDVIVIGSGPNGLVGAVRLAQKGLSVLVLESNPKRPGGAVSSDESTIPGFVHDFGAAFFPLARVSPAFRALPLERHGLTWLNAPVESCHPALDGTSASILRMDAERSLGSSYFGNAEDTASFERIARAHAQFEPALFRALLGPLPSWRPLFELGLLRLLRLGAWFASSTRGLSARWFRSVAARRVLPGLSLHGDLGPDDFAGAAMAYVLGLTASSVGFPVPQGGAQRVTDALVTLLELSGGELRLGARVERIVVRQGRAAAVRVSGGDEIKARIGVLADTAPAALFLDLLAGEAVPSWALAGARRFRHAWGTFKVDWALAGAVPWRDERARQSATVHVGESVEDLARFTAEVREGKLPQQPYLVVGQQSLIDPSRAPLGAHTLYAYTHVPSELEGGWDAARERFTEQVELRIEALAPGFRSLILGRKIHSPPELRKRDENLVGGDLGGGSNRWSQQLIFRPFFPLFRYKTPVSGLYLCSSSTHPGGGTHGMCGHNAAGRLLRDAGIG
jgi:phytoene dehydrogenase-like protein